MRTAVDKGVLEVTVATRDNYLTVHGLVAEMVTGRISPGSLVNPARRVFRPARVHVGEIEEIDLGRRIVVTSRSLDGALTELGYDQLLLALGTAEDIDAYPGLAEHAFRLKRFEDCLRLRNHIVQMLELADIERDPAERRRLLTFVIAGGGFSGTELAGELADFVRLLTKREFVGIRREECRVVVVHPGQTLLPELYGASNLERPVKSFPRLVEFAMKHAEKAGVELMLNTRVAAASPHKVHLSDGEQLATRTIVSAVGTRPNRLLETLPLERDDRGRLLVDEFLRVKGRPEVWAGGDCASVLHPHGGTCPPVALYACVHGRRIGANVVRSVRGRPLKPYRVDVKLQGVSIGRRTAVGEIGGLGMRGRLPWFAWRTVVSMVVPSWDRRLRLLADWLVWPLVGRDITQIGSASTDDYEIEHNVFQPGDVMFERQRPVRYVHIIVEGAAEVIRGAGDAAEQIESLVPGEYFGKTWLERVEGDAVRALTVVKTLSIPANQAVRLQRVLASSRFGPELEIGPGSH
jgi:NADH dehydrogenase